MSRAQSKWESFENFDLVSGREGRPSVYGERRDQLLEKLREVHCCSRYDLPAKFVKHFDAARFIRERLKQ